MHAPWRKAAGCCRTDDMGYPEFSVAMCVYGGDNPAWFYDAVRSILDQTVVPSEVVLVVDGPVPDPLECVIREFESQPVFRVIRLPENQGHGNARRASLAHCSNELVALMDADDLSVPSRFERQLACFAEHPEASVIGGNIAEFCGDEENVVGYRSLPSSDAELREYMKTRCPMNQMTVMFKKSHVEAAGGYVDWYCDEDYYLWLRMYLRGMRFANVPEVLCRVRVGEDMYRRRGGWRYFKSEAKLQKFMLDENVIRPGTFCMNVLKRLIVQVLLPNRLRGWVFQKFARSCADHE